MGLRLLSAAFALAFASAAFAQTPSVTLRGTIETVSADGGALTMKTRAGEAATVRVKPDLPIALVVPATLADVKQGSFIGVAAVPAAQEIRAPSPVVRDLRRRARLTQLEFAARLGVPVETIRNWEQGKRSPRGPARALLAVIAHAPETVFAALASDPEPISG